MITEEAKESTGASNISVNRINPVLKNESGEYEEDSRFGIYRAYNGDFIYATGYTLSSGKIPVTLKIELSDGSVVYKDVKLTVKNPKSKLVDSETTHTVSLSMERTTFDGYFTLKNDVDCVIAYIEQTGASPFTLTDTGDGTYRVTAKYKSLLKAGKTYKVKAMVWTDYDCENYAGTPVTITIKVIK